jgi:hypothetical protein
MKRKPKPLYLPGWDAPCAWAVVDEHKRRAFFDLSCDALDAADMGRLLAWTIRTIKWIEEGGKR